MGLLFSSEEGSDSSPFFYEETTTAPKVTEIPEPLGPTARAKAAIIGAFVADSLSAYSNDNDDNDEDKFISSFEEQEKISVVPINNTISLHSKRKGHQSFYGEEAFPFLQLISTRGYFESIDACEEAFQILCVFKEKDGGHSKVHPVMKEFYDRRIEGYRWEECSNKDDIQFLSITKVPILVARYAGSPKLLEKVEEAVRIYQTHPRVLAACRLSARLLERVVLGHSVADTLHWATTLAEASRIGTKKSPRSGIKKGTTLDSYEREFLTSILPSPAVAMPCHSYGSCAEIASEVHAMNESSHCDDTACHCNSADAYRTGFTSIGSSDAGCVDASGALSYYLACSRSNSYESTSRRDSISKSNAHHRRALSGNGSGPLGARSVPFSLAVEEIGLSSQLPECLQASLYGLHIFHSYKTAIRANIMTGGDNVCRSWLIGAMLAAEQGEEAIPRDWFEQTVLHAQIATMAGRLAGSNPYFETLKEKGCKISVLLS